MASLESGCRGIAWTLALRLPKILVGAIIILMGPAAAVNVVATDADGYVLVSVDGPQSLGEIVFRNASSGLDYASTLMRSGDNYTLWRVDDCAGPIEVQTATTYSVHDCVRRATIEEWRLLALTVDELARESDQHAAALRALAVRVSAMENATRATSNEAALMADDIENISISVGRIQSGVNAIVIPKGLATAEDVQPAIDAARTAAEAADDARRSLQPLAAFAVGLGLANAAGLAILGWRVWKPATHSTSPLAPQPPTAAKPAQVPDGESLVERIAHEAQAYSEQKPEEPGANNQGSLRMDNARPAPPPAPVQPAPTPPTPAPSFSHIAHAANLDIEDVRREVQRISEKIDGIPAKPASWAERLDEVVAQVVAPPGKSEAQGSTHFEPQNPTVVAVVPGAPTDTFHLTLPPEPARGVRGNTNGNGVH